MKTALNAKLLLPGVKTTSNRDAVKPEFSWHTSNASDSRSNMADVEEDNAKRDSNDRAIVLRLKNMIVVVQPKGVLVPKCSLEIPCCYDVLVMIVCIVVKSCLFVRERVQVIEIV